MNITRKISTFKSLLKHRKLLKSVISPYSFFLENSDKLFWGSITAEDEKGIKQAVILASNHSGPIIEIGALFGHTTCLIASLKQKEIRLIAVENFSWNPFHLSPEAHRLFTKRSLRYLLDHCSTELFDGDTSQFYTEYSSLKPSMIFIDAAHDYESVKQDIAWAISTECPVIAGHDYMDFHPDVIRAVDEAFGSKITLFGSVWIYSKQ